MAGRFEIEAVFKAQDQMMAPFARMQRRIESFVEGANKGLGKIEKFNSRISSGFKAVGGLAAGAAVGAAGLAERVVSSGAEFDKMLVGAAARFDPALKRGTAGFEKLRKAAEDIGAKTEFNALQGAAALKSFASAGFDAEQAIASLPGTVDFATASEVDLGVASDMATKALGAFGLKVDNAVQLGKNLTRVTDVMAMAANVTEASMSGLYESIREGAPVAVAAGASMETFTAMAASLSSAGIEGSIAGTTLKDTFLSLSAPTAKAAAQLKKMGIVTKDSSGNLRDGLTILGDIEKVTGKMGTAKRTAVLERIFGRVPLAGISKMLEMGTGRIMELRTKLEHSEGATKKMADAMRDTVAGDIDSLTSAIDGVKNSIFSANNGPIRQVLQTATAWIDKNKEMIVDRIQQGVQWVSDHLPQIVTWVERVGKAAVAFYVFDAGVKTVRLSIEAYEAAVAIAKGTQWLFTGSLAATQKAAQAAAGVEGLGGLRAGLNATALAQQINGVNTLLGKAGLLGAAAAVGLAFGSWLNETFHLDEKISKWIADLTGLGKQLDRYHKTTTQGLGASDFEHLADGSIRRHDGTYVYKSPTRLAQERMSTMNFDAGIGRSPILDPATFADKLAVTPLENAAAPTVQPLPRYYTEPQKVEITIKDQSGSAEVTKKPKGGASIILKPSGAF